MKLLYSSIIIAFFLSSACAEKAVMPKDQSPVTEPVVPGKILNLTSWKLTLPINTGIKLNPDEIKQPILNTYTNPDYFFSNKTGDAITFRANCGGFTTTGSNFPRSELREMTNNGSKSAGWSSAIGTHTMFIDQRITHLPVVRKHMVVGQIHDADKYLIFFRIEDDKLLVSVNGADRDVLDEHYVLGTRFNVKLVVKDNQTLVYYNDNLKYTYKMNFEGAYFKAGAYVQSSCQGEKKTPGELCSAYGEVEIYNVWVKHE
jgi:hypothetical protein